LGSDFTYPKIAIVDPELMTSMPSKITAATGFDVLAHAIEAYTSTGSTPMTDMYCEEAIRIVGRYLRTAVKNGKDLEARTQMAWADTLAGFSISVAVITLCHGMAHAVGGVAETIHGESLAAMTPYTMEFSMSALPERYRNIAMFLKDACTCDKDKFKPEDSIAEVKKIIKDIGMDIPLSKQGVKESDLEEIAKGSVGYMAGALDLDPKKATKEDVLKILKKAF
jgi:alcohol dehydrogenase class IV